MNDGKNCVAIRVVREDGKIVVYIEGMGKPPRSGLRIPEGQTWTVEHFTMSLPLLGVLNEVGVTDKK